jgi:hypothetical protein
MKKLNMLLIVAVLVAALMAQAVPAKLIRLEVYNYTGENVFMRLEGIVTGQFYYLTIPPTTRANWYQPKVYTILTDYYRRTTWACGGVESTGQLRIIKNFRMNFTACDVLPQRWTDPFGTGLLFKAPNFGEPTMEKVVYFQKLTNYAWVKVPLNVPLGIDSNLWLTFSFDINFLNPGGTVGYGVPFELGEFCAPNNCFYRLLFNPFDTGVDLLIPDGAAYGPGANNYFRYRY